MTITENQPADVSTDDTVDGEAVAEFAEKVFADLLGAMNTYALTIGAELGWYDALASGRPMTSEDLAAATDTDERYAREWLEHQTVAGYLDVLDPSVGPTERRYSLAPAAVAVLADRESADFMAPFGSFLSTLGGNLDDLIRVYRTGEGFGWHDHGDGARCGQAEANRPVFVKLLTSEYLPSIADVHAMLRAGGRIADVGCGFGWSAIAIAQAYPDVTIDGYDIDEPSIERAHVLAEEAGVADRVRFHTVDVGDLEASGYDVVFAFECVHDMPDPVSVLSAMHSMTAPGGAVIVMDERVGDTFTGEPDPIEQLYYGFSLVCCLPDGRNAPESVATGTVMRLPTFEGYAREAGFVGVDVLPIDNDLFRFYRLQTS